MCNCVDAMIRSGSDNDNGTTHLSGDITHTMMMADDDDVCVYDGIEITTKMPLVTQPVSQTR